jgi:mannosyl-oligosaccharide alpha-1,2-mannosidase
VCLVDLVRVFNSANMPRLNWVLLGALFTTALALPHNNPDDLNETKRQQRSAKAGERAQAVVDTFRIAWDGYYKHAFPHDELHPVSNGFSDSR